MARDPFRVLSLFSGGGGLDLAVRLAIRNACTVCYVEGDIQAARVLAARMEAGDLDPAPVWSDVRTFNGVAWRGVAWRGRMDLIHGGFPCQDISVAGKGAGISGEKSGLWGEYARIIREVRPRLVFIENVAALTSRGLDRVLGDLAGLGFDAEWATVSAGACGAPHRRSRIFILAHANGGGREGERGVRLLDGQRETRGNDADRRSLWPPGPEDQEGWGEWGGARPAIRRGVDGTTRQLDGRVDRLRILGNGVVPIQGAVALLALLARIRSGGAVT